MHHDNEVHPTNTSTMLRRCGGATRLLYLQPVVIIRGGILDETTNQLQGAVIEIE